MLFAVSDVPSDQTTSSRIFQVILVRSAEMPPFSRGGTRVARTAAISPFGLYSASGSMTSDAASTSLVPLERYGLRIVGACQ